jgi:hypothetical protein
MEVLLKTWSTHKKVTLVQRNSIKGFSWLFLEPDKKYWLKVSYGEIKDKYSIAGLLQFG